MEHKYDYTYWLFDRLQQAHIPNEQGHSAESLEDAKEQCIALFKEYCVARTTLNVAACRSFEEDGQTKVEERIWQCDYDDTWDEQVWEEVI
jgi:hypothetical protein